MTEDFLQFIWKYGLFERESMRSDTGEPVRVIGLGEHNTNAGPDFVNARIRIGETTWAGNVEVHLRSADWHEHRHSDNKAYDNVILHVVYSYSRPVTRSNGEIIPTVTLVFKDSMYENYRALLQAEQRIACAYKIGRVDAVLLDCWFNSLVIERLQEKTAHAEQLLDQTANNWEEVLYRLLARSLGSLNAEPFEMLAKSLPLKVLKKHGNCLFQLEALLHGQAGFLDKEGDYGAYYVGLRKEYHYLAKKYNLVPMGRHLWKFLRLRPANFPTVRIAQLAALVMHFDNLFRHILTATSMDHLSLLLSLRPSAFWDTHYTFEKTTVQKDKTLGKQAAIAIMINAIVPWVFTYGRSHAQEELKNKAINWLMELPAEKNRITAGWSAIGIQPASAFYSQALLQLTKKYCSRKRCLACSVGTSLIARNETDF